MTHSLPTTAAISERSGESGDAIFVTFLAMGNKLGIGNSHAEWFLSGRFPSVPGALYMSLGLKGVLISALTLGFLTGFLNGLFTKHSNSVFISPFCSIFESVLLLSPFLFAGDFFFFAPMVIGGCITIALSAQMIKIDFNNLIKNNNIF